MQNQSTASPEAVTKFDLGRLFTTPNALDQIPIAEAMTALARHARGDWGTLTPHDFRANEEALKDGGRVFSIYYSSSKVKFWIITEADRSMTTVLLPEDY